MKLRIISACSLAAISLSLISCGVKGPPLPPFVTQPQKSEPYPTSSPTPTPTPHQRGDSTQ